MPVDAVYVHLITRCALSLSWPRELEQLAEQHSLLLLHLQQEFYNGLIGNLFPLLKTNSKDVIDRSE